MDVSRRETFDLTALVHEVAADADFEGRAHNREVKVVSAEACQMSGVSELVRSAVENIVRNAVRHTRPGTMVEVSLSRERVSPQTRSGRLNRMEELQKSMARLRVRDYGPGVHPQELQKIFLPFHRVQTTTPYRSVVTTTTLESESNGSRKDLPTDGAGLGLAIADRVVRMHHGTIETYNAPDGGLIIDVQFPLV